MFGEIKAGELFCFHNTLGYIIGEVADVDQKGIELTNVWRILEVKTPQGIQSTYLPLPTGFGNIQVVQNMITCEIEITKGLRQDYEAITTKLRAQQAGIELVGAHDMPMGPKN